MRHEHANEGGRAAVVVAVLLCIGVAAVAWYALATGATPPDRPVAVAWDEQTCAHCRMHVGAPGFAAQLHLDNGEVLHFDDPGCLFAWRADHPDAEVHATYFHHAYDTRWLARDEAVFVRVDESPMGTGLAAVDVATGETLTYDEARRAALGPRGELR